MPDAAEKIADGIMEGLARDFTLFNEWRESLSLLSCRDAITAALLAEREAGRVEGLEEGATNRWPTKAEAVAAAKVLMRCNGHDLDTWSSGGASPEFYDGLKAIARALKTEPRP